MGVPALFRWLSRKYPRIVKNVEEQDNDMRAPNPNGVEFDNLYLDMNGIVHPCTHPEGRPPPKSEEEMMEIIFEYTERIVRMIRPRKLLLIAIDGVAPRAKMNQQRSRRFRSAQEAQQKETDKENIFSEKGDAQVFSKSEQTLLESKPWDSNCITPGTPFMSLLSASLQYWIVKKLNEDPSWAQLKVILSDASVPGEGEHKIMDFVRRQRVQPGYNPNTQHVIYGLDADLIMLSLATHEVNFRILREDVFGQNKGSNLNAKDSSDDAKKPFIFLDVATLREYLAIELGATPQKFAFNLERAIDDWVFLIFLVGNDFLPHLPSVEIREGAIDMLVGIWKSMLLRIDGYITNQGSADLNRVQLLMNNLASREQGIFERRHAKEERDKQRNKEKHKGKKRPHDHEVLTVSGASGDLPVSNKYAEALKKKLKEEKKVQQDKTEAERKEFVVPDAPQTNKGLIANRAALRMASLNQGQLDSQVSGVNLVQKTKQEIAAENKAAKKRRTSDSSDVKQESSADIIGDPSTLGDDDDEAVKEEPSASPTKVEDESKPLESDDPGIESLLSELQNAAENEDVNVKEDPQDGVAEDHVKEIVENAKPQLADPEVEEDVLDYISEVEDEEEEEEEEQEENDNRVKFQDVGELVMLGDNAVEQEDKVRLWEPGAKERYYQLKFGQDHSNVEFRNSVVKSYTEGLLWVLEYYYQGTPSWQWYYPHHFAPFTSDFKGLGQLKISFDKGRPFRPYEQLMGVLPAASSRNLPEPLALLMSDPSSPIVDFYPNDFKIDMDGKRMIWQGIALLPFIDERRLLDAMKPAYADLSEDEIRRNSFGNAILFASSMDPVYSQLEDVYARSETTGIPLMINRAQTLAGFVKKNPKYVPGATYPSPLSQFPDIPDDTSLNAFYAFPPQLRPHASVLLPGAMLHSQLDAQDKSAFRSGLRLPQYGSGGGFHQQRAGTRDPMQMSSPDYAFMGRGGHWNSGPQRPYRGRGGYGSRGRGQFFGAPGFAPGGPFAGGNPGPYPPSGGRPYGPPPSRGGYGPPPRFPNQAPPQQAPGAQGNKPPGRRLPAGLSAALNASSQSQTPESFRDRGKK